MYLFTSGFKETTTGMPYAMVTIGSEVWITLSGLNVGVYNIVFNLSETLIDLSNDFTNDPSHIVTDGTYVYVFEQKPASLEYEREWISSFVKIEIATKTIVASYPMIYDAHCVPIYAESKIWFVTPAQEFVDIASADAHRIFYFNTTTPGWTLGDIMPANKQFEENQITLVGDFVFVNSFNENGIHKINKADGSYNAFILVNRRPSAFALGSAGELLVSSYSGMVSAVDVVTNAVTNVYATTDTAVRMYDDGTYLWALPLNSQLQRITKIPTGDPLAHEVLIIDGDENDFNIKEFADTILDDFLISDLGRFIIRVPDGFLVAYGFQDSWDLIEKRQYELSVQCTAMIATGPQKYYGETE